MKKYLTLTALVLATIITACGTNDPVPPDDTPPGRVTDLQVKSAALNVITLRWTTPGDNGKQGTARSYQVRWSPGIITESNFGSAHAIPDPPVPAAPGTVELFAVPNMDITEVTYFALRTYDDTGLISPISNNAVWTPGSRPVQFATDIPALKDNTMYSEFDSLSNGSGEHFIVGSAGPEKFRRALLAFAITDSLPAGAEVDSVRLVLHMSWTTGGTRILELHRAGADWGEGASDAPGDEAAGAPAQANDATWGFRFFDTSMWATAGGDFEGAASASTSVGSIATYTWTSAQMRDDVQHWLDVPDSTFGWVMTGDESGLDKIKRFDSREHPIAAYRPRLKVYYRAIP